MTSPFLPTEPLLRDERGFTLPELLIAMTIGLLMMFAMLTVFETFDRGIASNSALTDAEDSGRRDVAEMVRILRDAGEPAPTTGNSNATLISAGDNDVVFRSTSWPGESATGTGTNIQRLCLDTATKTVWFDGRRASVAGPDDPGTSCPSTATGWTHSPIATNVANTAALPLFRIGASPVRSIAITLRTDSSTARSTSSLALRSGGTMRGSLPPAVTEDDIALDCNEDEPASTRRPLLSLAADTGLKLSAAGAITAGPAKILLAAGTTGQVALTVTNPFGLQTLLFKEITC